jgi:hypothetical protein
VYAARRTRSDHRKSRDVVRGEWEALELLCGEFGDAVGAFKATADDEGGGSRGRSCGGGPTRLTGLTINAAVGEVADLLKPLDL